MSTSALCREVIFLCSSGTTGLPAVPGSKNDHIVETCLKQVRCMGTTRWRLVFAYCSDSVGARIANNKNGAVTSLGKLNPVGSPAEVQPVGSTISDEKVLAFKIAMVGRLGTNRCAGRQRSRGLSHGRSAGKHRRRANDEEKANFSGTPS